MHISRTLLLAYSAYATPLPTSAVTPDPVRLTVMTFNSTENGVGAKAADALRSRLSHDFSDKQLVTTPTDAVQNALQQSAFVPDEPLDSGNEKLLAQLLGAEYYITGVINHTASGYQLLTRLVLSRDPSLTQPLPRANGKTIETAVAPVSTALRGAMKQLDAERRCVSAARSGDAQKAIASAQSGVAVYPQATLVRMCELDVYWGVLYQRATTRSDSMRYADSALAVSRAILAIDSTNMHSLKAQAELYPVTGDSVHARQALLNLARANPHDATLVNQVINSLVANHDISDAVQLTQTLLADKPNDPHVLRTAFLVSLYAEQWQSAVALGPRLIAADTSAADSTYFIRMASAYQAQHEPQQMIAVLQRGTAKFPNNAGLWQLYAQNLRQAGRTAQADTALRRAIALNPRMTVALLQLAEVYMTNHQPDSAYALLQQATSSPGADKQLIAQTALAQGGHLYQGAAGPTSRGDYQQAVLFLRLSNQLTPSTDAQFLSSAASFALMQSAAQEANDKKSCPLARLAQQAAGDVPDGLAVGARDPKYQGPATQMSQALPQLRSAIEKEVKKFCH